MSAAEPGWSVREARARVPAELVSTHSGLCKPNHPIAGCPGCRWLMRERAKARGAKDAPNPDALEAS